MHRKTGHRKILGGHIIELTSWLVQNNPYIGVVYGIKQLGLCVSVGVGTVIMATPKKLKTPTFSKVWHYYEGLWATLDTTIRGQGFRFVAPLPRINPDMPEMSHTYHASF